MKSTTMSLVVGVGLLALSPTSEAAWSDTLANLTSSGGSLTIDDKVFSGFSYSAFNMPLFNANLIVVTAAKVGPGLHGPCTLTWSGPTSIATLGPTIADLLLNYTVTVDQVASPGGAIWKIDQKYTGTVNPAGAGFLSIDETLSAGAIVVANSHLDQSDLSDPFAEVGDSLTLQNKYSTVQVTKDIALGIAAPGGGLISISKIEQSFIQVPEPTSVIAGALLLLPFGATAVRLLRKRA